MSLASNNKATRQILELTLTERCNLDCVYCYEKKKDLARMPVELAKQAIADALSLDEFDELEIDFHGGEPFLAFKEIQNICEWLWSDDRAKPYICFATTNGTLIRGKIREWVTRNHKRLILGLSLDGTPEMHNANRSNSYSQIDVKYFRELWPFQPIKMTLSRLTLPRMAEGVIFLHQLGVRFTCNCAYGIDWQPNDYSVFAQQLRELTDFYLNNPEVEPCDIATLPIEHIFNNDGHRKACGAGTSLSCVDRHGKKYPCHNFMPSSAAKDFDVDELFDVLRASDLTDPKCQGCPISPVCPTCYGLSFVETGNLASRNLSHCRFAKIRAKGTAYLSAQMLANRHRGYAHLRKKANTEICNLIRAIEILGDLREG
jgi:uncharacterized protein